MNDKKLTEIKAAKNILLKWNCGQYRVDEALEEFRKLLAPTPAQVDGDVIGAMLDAYHGDLNKPSHYCSAELPRMTAAATVLLDRVLGLVTDEEFEALRLTRSLWDRDISAFLANRRNSILKLEPPSLEQEIDHALNTFRLQSKPWDSTEITASIMTLISRHSEVQHGK